MKCDEIRELISCMLDNELSAEDSAKVTDHLAQCPECMRVFEAFHAISLSLEQMEEVPENFTADVMEKVQRTAQRKKTKKTKPTHLRFVRTAAMAACVALVVLTGSRFIASPLYAGGGRPYVANYIRTQQDGQFTPTPAPTPEVIPGDESTNLDPNAGLMTMELGEDDLNNTPALPEASPTAVEEPTVTPTPVPEVTPTPVPTVTPTPVPSPALTMQTDLLVVMEAAQPGKFASAPSMELRVQSPDGRSNELALWAEGSRLYCENRTNGTAYYTIGTPEELHRLTGLPVAQAEAIPSPTPQQ